MSGKGREMRLDDGFHGRVECRTYPGGILDIIHQVCAICARGCVLVAHSTSPDTYALFLGTYHRILTGKQPRGRQTETDRQIDSTVTCDGNEDV